MLRVLLVLTTAAWMAAAGSAAAAPPPPPPPGHIAFEAGPNSPVTVGTRPKGIAVGDLDGDGDLDFVTANTGSDTYTPVYGNGVGGFTPGIPEDTGDGPESIVLADFDGDTRLDIAVANRNADTVWVMLQESPGEFDQLEPIPSGGDAPVALAAGRLDANASVDLVVANSMQDTNGAGMRNFTVLLNDGTGFSPAGGSPIASSFPYGLVLEDVDEDGASDIFSADGFLRLGGGDGTFAPGTRIAVPGGRVGVATGDMDGDGHLDLLAAGAGGSSSSTLMLLGNGAGGFHLHDEFLLAEGLGFYPSAVATGRFNADPYADVLGTAPTLPSGSHGETDGTARVFLGDDDGGLTSSNVDGPWNVGLGPNAVAVGDFDNDGRPDFLAANSGNSTTGANTVSVLLNTTPWPLAQFSGDVADFGQRGIGTISPDVATLTATNAGHDMLRVRRADFGGSNPDDFIKSSDGCTGVGVAPGGSCSIHVRFAPTAEGDRAATLRLLDNTVAGSHTAAFSGVGAAPSTGGGETGPQGPPGSTGLQGPAGPAGAAGTNGTNGAPGQKGLNGGPGENGQAGPQGAAGAQGPQGATGPRGPAGRNATVTCKPKRTRSGDVRVTCTVRFVSRVARSTVRVRLVRGSTVYATTRRTVRKGRVAIRVHPRARLHHARYRLLLTFVDRNGRATTVSQRVRLDR